MAIFFYLIYINISIRSWISKGHTEKKDGAKNQKGTVFQNSALRAPFSTKRLKMVPSWKKGTVFVAKKVEGDALFSKGHQRAPFSPQKKVKNGAVL